MFTAFSKHLSFHLRYSARLMLAADLIVLPPSSPTHSSQKVEDSSDVARLVVSESHPTLNSSAADYLVAYVPYNKIAGCAWHS